MIVDRHIVGWGETFAMIARKYYVTIDDIYRPGDDAPVDPIHLSYVGEVVEIHARGTGPKRTYIITEDPF